jgi:acetolactate synthase-1/2/3 large subunit
MIIHGDAKIFIKKLLEIKINPIWSEWLEWNIQRKNRYPVVLKEYKNSDKVHPYFFVKELTTNLKDNDIVVAGNGTACVALFQAGVVKSNQRIFWNSGCASMGYDLPAAIGACFSNYKYDIICLTGEGSLQMNIQEFATIKHYNLPIKTFVLNNNGYCSIRQTQSNFFNGRYVGCDESSGLYFPSLKKIAKTYGIPYKKLSTNKNLNKKIKKILNTPGSAIIEVDLTLNYIFSPKLSSEKLPDGRLISKPLEDLYPFLSREEFEENIIKDWKY